MKSFFGFSLRLFAVKIVVEIIYALMLLFILMNIKNNLVSILVALMGIGVFMMLLWDYASRQGTKDSITLEAMGKTKAMGGKITNADIAGSYKPWKGFAAAATAAAPSLILTTVTVVLMLTGNNWGHAMHSLMSVLNTTYMPIFQSIDMPNSFLNLSMIPDGMPISTMLNIKNTVLPYMFYIPQIIFILWGGASYILGHHFRQQLKPKR